MRTTTITRRLALGATTLVLAFAPAAVAAASPPTAVIQAASSTATASWATATATWSWTGPGKTGSVTVYVKDTGCDSAGAYAYMEFKRKGTGQIVTGASRPEDSSCKGAGVTTKLGGFSDDYNIASARVVVCKDDHWWPTADTCKKGSWSSNPKA